LAADRGFGRFVACRACPVVEREAELAKLRGLIGGAAGGAGTLALVEGAAGLGAASLAGSLLEFSAADGPVHSHRPAGDIGFGTLHGLYWLTYNLAAKVPVLIALDDAHWSDPASLRFAAFLTARLEGLPVLLLVALRPGERTPAGELLETIRSDAAANLLSPAELSERGCEQPASDLAQGTMIFAGSFDPSAWSARQGQCGLT
jgi:hypothetical protein